MDNDQDNHININIHCADLITNNKEPTSSNGIGRGIGIGLGIFLGGIAGEEREGRRVGGDGGGWTRKKN